MTDVSAQDVLDQALMIAVSNADEAMAKRLMARGANPDVPLEGSQSAFGLAVNLQMFDLAAFMIARGSNVNFQKEPGISSPQWVACVLRDAFKGGSTRTAFFAKHGADFDMTFSYGTRSHATLEDVLHDVRAIMTAPERANLKAVHGMIRHKMDAAGTRAKQHQLAKRQQASGRKYKL